MSSGVAINRKLQRDAGVKKNQKVSRDMNQVPNRRLHRGSTQQVMPPKFVKGTPTQKNWYLLTLHEKRLARLESWAQSKDGEQVQNGDQKNNSLELRGIVSRLEKLENENRMLRHQMQHQEKNSVSLEVEEHE